MLTNLSLYSDVVKADLQNRGREVLSDKLLDRLEWSTHTELQPVTIAIATLQLLWRTQAAE